MRLNRALVLAVAASAAITASAFGGKVRVTDAGGYLDGTDGSGGAFTITTIDPYNGENSGPGSSASSFASFCVERDEFLGFGGEYYTRISTVADAGGNGGPDPDPLSSASALLYQTFRDGGAIPGVGLIDDSDKVSGLQYALWRLEEETGGESVAAASAYATTMVTWATGAANGTLYNVRVLQLWDNPDFTGVRQDVLTIVPTPQASLAGMSLLAGMGGMGLIKRRRQNRDLD